MCSRKTSDVLFLKMYGLLTSDAFQRAKICAETLHSYLPEMFCLPEVHGLLDMDWEEYLITQRRENGGAWWDLQRPVATFVNDRFIGSDEDMFDVLSTFCMFELPPDHVPYNIADYLNPRRSYCYMDIAIGGKHVGSFTFELFDDVVPNTCDNFRMLCTGNPSYEGSEIHRIAIPSFIQGGILQSGEVAFFSDENYAVSHDKRGILSMANDGVNTNGSQFFIVLSPATWMDRKYVAFGRLVEGADTLAAIEQVPTYYEMPTKRIQITACGLKYEAPAEPVEAEVTPEESTTEVILRYMLDEILEKMEVTEPELPDERDAESVLTMEKYKRGEYSPGITEDMLSDVEPLDEDLPESLKVVWLLLREMVSDKTLITAFARRLINEIVEAVFKEMRIKDAFWSLLAALKKWPQQFEALMALVRKVLKDTKRHIDILDLGPKVVIVRELLDEVLDRAISMIQAEEDMVVSILEEIVTESFVFSCMRQLLPEIINTAMERSQLKEPEALGEYLEPHTEEGGGSEVAEEEAEEKTDEAGKPSEKTDEGDKLTEEKADKADKAAEKSTEVDKPAEETADKAGEPTSEEKASVTEEGGAEGSKSAEGDKDVAAQNEEAAATAEPAGEATEEKTDAAEG